MYVELSVRIKRSPADVRCRQGGLPRLSLAAAAARHPSGFGVRVAAHTNVKIPLAQEER